MTVIVGGSSKSWMKSKVKRPRKDSGLSMYFVKVTGQTKSETWLKYFELCIVKLFGGYRNLPEGARRVCPRRFAAVSSSLFFKSLRKKGLEVL